MPENPQRGKGNKYLDCEFYNDCLDVAVEHKWESFHCEACDYYKEWQGGKQVKLCKECGQRPTIQPTSLYCAQCMSKRAHAKGPKKPKKEKPVKAPPKPELPQKATLTIEFGEYKDILGQIEELAKEEMRPIELQVIYILNGYLKGIHGTSKGL